MKKTMMILLIIIMVFTFASCGEPQLPAVPEEADGENEMSENNIVKPDCAEEPTKTEDNTADAEDIDEIPVGAPGGAPVTVVSDGVTITPYMVYAFSAEWTENGMLCGDGPFIGDVLPELYEEGKLETLNYAEDFRVLYASYADAGEIYVFDENYERLPELSSSEEIEDLPGGTYFIGFFASWYGEFIEEAGEREMSAYVCTFRLIKE